MSDVDDAASGNETGDSDENSETESNKKQGKDKVCTVLNRG
jgi:hypothetical protein